MEKIASKHIKPNRTAVLFRGSNYVFIVG